MTIRARNALIATLPACGTLRITQGREFTGSLAEDLYKAYPKYFNVLIPSEPLYHLVSKGGGNYEIQTQSGQVVRRVRGRAKAKKVVETLTNDDNQSS